MAKSKRMRTFSGTVVLIFIFIVGTLFTVDLLNPQFGFFAKVNAGYVGVREYFGSVPDEPLQPGFHITRYFEKVRPIDVRTQRNTYQMEAFSSDIQQVTVAVAVNSNISPESAGILYRTIGMNYLSTLVEPRLFENVKVVISQYTAESLIAKRQELSRQILERMQADIAQYGVIISNISVENLDFTDAYEQIVEAKQVATQEKLRAKTQQEQQTMEAEQAATRKKIEAEAAAEVAKVKADADAYAIQAKAEAEAAANRKISESLTDNLIQYHKINAWDGKLPSYIGGESTIPVIDMAQ
jgi:regulator of protease activity HflC (stomatin/prohibitin superfamily)